MILRCRTLMCTLSKKIQMLQCHQSQLRWLCCTHICTFLIKYVAVSPIPIGYSCCSVTYPDWVFMLHCHLSRLGHHVAMSSIPVKKMLHFHLSAPYKFWKDFIETSPTLQFYTLSKLVLIGLENEKSLLDIPFKLSQSWISGIAILSLM